MPPSLVNWDQTIPGPTWWEEGTDTPVEVRGQSKELAKPMSYPLTSTCAGACTHMDNKHNKKISVSVRWLSA